MGFFNLFNKKAYNRVSSSNDLPISVSNRYNTYLTASGNGQIYSLLSTKLPGSKREWQKEAGDLGLNSIVSVCLDFYIRNWTQAKFKVARDVNENEKEYINHPILELLKNPDSKVPSSVFWSWIIQDFKLLGNAYIRKIRVNGKVTALQYLPADMIAPFSEGDEFLSYYVYTVSGTQYKLNPEDIMHFRYLRDPNDIRLGRSAITSVLREIATDNAASSTAYGLMKNNALPSIILGPDANDYSVDISPDDARTVKKRLMQDFQGDNAGNVAVMTGAYKLDKISWSPEEMVLDQIRKLPEERIVAAMGLNVMVLGLGSGLDHSTYSNYERAQQAAWEDGIIPLQNQIVEVINEKLMYEFPETSSEDYVCFDYSNVRALADDLVTAASRAERLYVSGIATRAEAKRIANLPVESSDEDVYYGSTYTATNGANLMVDNQEDYNKDISYDLLQLFDMEVKAAEHVVTDAMVTAANRALQWKREGFDGATRVGLTRANQISNREKLSDETVLRMYSFFSRHEVDKKAEGFNQGEEGFPSPGRVAWDAWGGDAGYRWSKKIRDKIMKERERD